LKALPDKEYRVQKGPIIQNSPILPSFFSLSLYRFLFSLNSFLLFISIFLNYELFKKIEKKNIERERVSGF
jgi:hypothetical protein